MANNKTMSVIGAARVVLYVGGRGVESEILIAPDLEELVLGIDWLRSQGRIRWDFDQGRIQFGDREWIELRREAKQPCRTSIIRSGQNGSPNLKDRCCSNRMWASASVLEGEFLHPNVGGKFYS